MLNRRRFLKLSLAGTATVVCAGGAYRWFAGGYSSQLAIGDQPISLSTKEFAVARAVATALFPGDAEFPSADALRLAQRLDEEIWANSDHLASDLKNGLQVFEHGPMLVGMSGRFSRMSLEDRQKCLKLYLTGSSDILRQVAGGLKMMLSFFYFAHPDVWPKIGYEGPFVSEPIPPASAIAYRELLKQKGAT